MSKTYKHIGWVIKNYFHVFSYTVKRTRRDAIYELMSTEFPNEFWGDIKFKTKYNFSCVKVFTEVAP